MNRTPAADLTVLATLKATLRALAASDRPIVVGPWLSEVGFEVLYWIPWLRWAVAFAGLRPDRIHVISRGGARSWYDGIAGGSYIDVLDFYAPGELVEGNRRRVAEQATRAQALGLKRNLQSSKQHTRTKFDDAILVRACRAAGLEDPQFLHPSVMYGFFRPFWRRRAPRLYHRSTVVRRMVAPATDLELPAAFVAAKFYSSQAFPDTPGNRAWVQATIAGLAESSDVVLLHTGTRFDDHGEFAVDAHPRIHRVALPVANNLDVQSAILGRATRFVGTYGGFAYLAPFLGVPTSTWYAEENFRRDHRDVIAEVAKVDLGVPFEIASTTGRRREVRRRVA